MTNEQIRRVNQAIDECNAYIAKEEKRSADLRPAKVTQILESTKAHKAKLERMLAGE